jgi:hypothetical protein
MKWSFDDVQFGLSKTGTKIDVRYAGRPVGLSNDQWYKFVGELAAALNAKGFPMSVGYDDDLAFEEFLALPKADQDAELRRAEEELKWTLKVQEDWLNSLPAPQRFAYLRHRWLNHIRKSRLRLRDRRLNQIECVNEVWRQGIRTGQLALVRLWEWRRGNYQRMGEPGRS